MGDSPCLHTVDHTVDSDRPIVSDRTIKELNMKGKMMEVRGE